MTTPHDTAELLPFYAAGTLDPAARREVEEHVQDCPECRDLLAHARAFREAVAGELEEPWDGHIQAQLLVEFHESPAHVDATARKSLQEHLGRCTLCSAALRILEDMPVLATDAKPEARPRDHPRDAPSRFTGTGFATRWAGLFAWLPGHGRLIPILVPAAVLLALMVPAYLLLTGGSGGPGRPQVERSLISWPGEVQDLAVLSAAIQVPGETLFRGMPGAAGAPPLRLEIPPAGQALLLEIDPDLDPADRADPLAQYRLEVLQGDRLLAQRVVPGEEFDDHGRLRVVLDPVALHTTASIRKTHAK